MSAAASAPLPATKPLEFVRVARRILSIPEAQLPFMSKLLFARIQLAAGESGECTLSLTELANDVGCVRTTLPHHLSRLANYAQTTGDFAGAGAPSAKFGRKAFRFTISPFRAFDKFKFFAKLPLEILACPSSELPAAAKCGLATLPVRSWNAPEGRV
jgi:hypothetical protein